MSEKLAEIIKFFMLVAGAVVLIWKAFDWLGSRDKEKSVGQTAIKAIEQRFLQIEQDLRIVKEKEGHSSEQIERVEQDLKALFLRILDYYRK